MTTATAVGTRTTQGIYLTPNGVEILENKIKALNTRIAELQAEKAVAYWGSGDGWHDNPGFNQLEQLEGRTISEMVKLKNRLENAKVWDAKLNTGKTVQIGTTTTYKQTNTKTGKTNSMTITLVGHLESDLKKMQFSYDSPIGKAINNKSIGEKEIVRIPMGEFELEILNIEN